MGREIHLTTRSRQETQELGRAIASLLGPGDVVALSGDLGAGKTTLVQGMVRGLGVDEPVVSPTFNLVREYAGNSTIYHLDVYRLDRLQDVLDLGFEEMVGGGAIVFIEWGDAIDALLPEDNLRLRLLLPAEGDRRAIEISAVGDRWAARWEALEGIVGSRTGA